jgi:hypothetical protein
MSDLLVRDTPLSLGVDGDERLARAELRRQIGRLEHQLSRHLAEGFPRVDIDTRVEAVAPAPRALGLGDLERVRDELAGRVADARCALEDRAVADARNRDLLEQMLERPADFKWLRISRQELGLPGCGHWHSRPRYGLLGMLMGWWRVKISSGCPL